MRKNTQKLRGKIIHPKLSDLAKQEWAALFVTADELAAMAVNLNDFAAAGMITNDELAAMVAADDETKC